MLMEDYEVKESQKKKLYLLGAHLKCLSAQFWQIRKRQTRQGRQGKFLSCTKELGRWKNKLQTNNI